MPIKWFPVGSTGCISSLNCDGCVSDWLPVTAETFLGMYVLLLICRLNPFLWQALSLLQPLTEMLLSISVDGDVVPLLLKKPWPPQSLTEAWPCCIHDVHSAPVKICLVSRHKKIYIKWTKREKVWVLLHVAFEARMRTKWDLQFPLQLFLGKSVVFLLKKNQIKLCMRSLSSLNCM